MSTVVQLTMIDDNLAQMTTNKLVPDIRHEYVIDLSMHPYFGH